MSGRVFPTVVFERRLSQPDARGVIHDLDEPHIRFRTKPERPKPKPKKPEAKKPEAEKPAAEKPVAEKPPCPGVRIRI